MKKLLGLAALCVAAGLSANPGLSATVSGNWDIVNATGQDANDLHITIRPARSREVTDEFNGPFGRPTITDVPLSEPVIEVKWAGATVKNGEEIHVGLEFDKEVNNMRIPVAEWTKDGRVIDKVDSILGFKAGGLFGASFFDLFNDGVERMTVRDLQFQIVDTVVPLVDLMPYDFSGWGASVPEFDILPGEALRFFPGAMAQGDFLLAQMDVFQTNDPADRSQLIYQHGVVPVPAAAWLLISACLAIAGLTRRRPAT